MPKLNKFLLLPALTLATLATLTFSSSACATEFDLSTLPSGQFEVNMYPPASYDEWMIMNEAIGEQAPGWGITSGGVEHCENANSCKLVHGGTDWTEEYYPIHYNYDSAIKSTVDTLIHSAGLDATQKSYHVQDLELMYAWIAEELGLETDLSNFSSELREALGNANLSFFIDQRMGCEAPLLTCKGGIGKVTQIYNGVPTLYYIIPQIEVLSENIFYVSSNTAEADLATALETRINNIYGEGVVTVVATDRTVADLGVTAEELPNLGHLTSLDETIYTIALNYGDGIAGPYDILIRADSAKIFTPSVNSTDLATGVNIATDAPFLPADAMAYAAVEPDQDGIVTELLGSENYTTYELGLYSPAFREEISDAEGYDFVVGIPVPEALAGKTLSAYWLHHTEDGDELEEHYATVDANGLAVFATNHFSTYILAESSADRPVIPAAPNTGLAQTATFSLVLAAFLSLTSIVTYAIVTDTARRR